MCGNSDESYEQFFHVVLFIMLYKLSLWMKTSCVTIQVEATEQYFHGMHCVVL